MHRSAVKPLCSHRLGGDREAKTISDPGPYTTGNCDNADATASDAVLQSRSILENRYRQSTDEFPAASCASYEATKSNDFASAGISNDESQRLKVISGFMQRLLEISHEWYGSL